MNILVVNENFTGGGLETHIHSYYMELRKRHHFVFAFGKYESELKFDEKDVHTDFYFGWDCSVKNFVDDVERLVQIIHEEKIDVIHAHPFHSIFAAAVAGQLAGVPVACTHHGTYSFVFPNGINEVLLLYYAYTELVSCVFSVSETGKQALERQAHVPNVIFMPNAVDFRRYCRHEVVSNRRWAAVSRLDSDLGKVDALKKLFEDLPYLPIDGIDVYGDGSQRQELKQYVDQLGLTDKVRFLGFRDNLYECLNGSYNGVIGSDRAALEGLTMGYPVLEVGYGRVCGVLCGELLQQAKTSNFVANTLPGLSSDTVAAQLEQVYAQPERFDFRQEMIETFDIQVIAKNYINQMSALSYKPHANMVTWFEELKTLPNQEWNVYTSQDVFWSLKRCVEPYAIDRSMKNLFLLGNNCIGLGKEINQVRTDLVEQAQGLQEQVQVQIREMQERFQTYQVEQVQALEQLRTENSNLLERLEQILVETSALTKRLEQLQEQTEYHRKILAPLLWLRRLLGKVKRKIKGWLGL